MRTVTTLALLVALTSLPASLMANDDRDAKATKKVKKVDKVQCKRVTVTGSHFKKKVCLKQSKWEEMAREAQDAANRLQDNAANSGS